jgi:hypothetical protein
MVFKVSKGCELYDKLKALMDRVNECDRAADALAKELGGTSCRKGYWTIGWGLSAITMPVKPKGWKNAHRDLVGEYMPSASNKEVVKKINELPKVEYNDLNSLVGYHNAFGHPGINVRDDYAFLTFSDKQADKLTPVDGMVEITVTEYKRLTAQ